MEHVQTDRQNGARLQIRINPDDYWLLERAAYLQGESLSRFVREVSLRKAKEVVRDHDSMQLSNADWELFFKTLEAPSEPNTKLKKAYARYQEKVSM